MKTQMGLFLNVGTADELRTRAGAVGAGVGDLADMLLRFALERVPEAVMRKWAEGQVSRKGRLAGGMTKNEKAVLQAFAVLAKKPANEGVWRFALSDLASEAGLRLTDCFWALKKLAKASRVEGMELDEVDRWGRPLKSFWKLATVTP